jgi:hypothetical protein
MTAQHRIFTTPVANVYPYYIAKAEMSRSNSSALSATSAVQFAFIHR